MGVDTQNSTDSRQTDAATVGGASAVGAAATQQAVQHAREVIAHQAAPTRSERAVQGWDLANLTQPLDAQASPRAQAVADASANARTAMTRQDLPPETQARVRTVVEHLGEALADGRLDAHVNDTFRSHLHDLATLSPADNNFQGALAQMNRAAEVLDRAVLAQGTQMLYDPTAGGVPRAGLPVLDVPNIDADLYFQTQDGTLHIESSASSTTALADKIYDKPSQSTSAQLQRQTDWQATDVDGPPRSLGLAAMQDGPRASVLLDDARMQQLTTTFGARPDERAITIGDRAYSLNDLRAIDDRLVAASQSHVDAGGTYRDFYAGQPDTLSGLAAAHPQADGSVPGQTLSPLERLPNDALPAEPVPMSARQGAAWGAAGSAVVSSVVALRDGQLTRDEAVGIAQDVAVGGGTGAVAAALEPRAAATLGRVATPALESVVASPAARAALTRAGGATVVGAAISAGVSAYTNREGLARGDSQAIGNVTADTAVAAGSIAAATAAGAAIGSVVPVAGTAVGAVVGLGVGVGVAYGAQISGARDAIADGVASAVDGVKNGARSLWSGVTSLF